MRATASTPSCVTRGRATTRPCPITATGWCSNCSTAGSARATSPTEAPYALSGANIGRTSRFRELLRALETQRGYDHITGLSYRTADGLGGTLMTTAVTAT